MLDGSHELVHQLGHAAATGISSASLIIGLWLVPAFVVGAIGYFMPRRFDGDPVASLLQALLGRSAEPGSQA
jgi:hypothetical protein